jgi:hypothetical protein
VGVDLYFCHFLPQNYHSPLSFCQISIQIHSQEVFAHGTSVLLGPCIRRLNFDPPRREASPLQVCGEVGSKVKTMADICRIVDYEATTPDWFSNEETIRRPGARYPTTGWKRGSSCIESPHVHLGTKEFHSHRKFWNK